MKPVKISRLIKNLQNILEEHGDLSCVYAIDEEGNGFDLIYWDPSLGMFNERQRDYLSLDEYNQLKEENQLWYPDKSEKVVCIN